MNPESALRTYVKAAVWTLPFAAAWIFSSIFLMPAVEEVWIQSGAHASKLSTIISISSTSLNHGRIILAGIILGIVCFEVWASWWPARRSIVIESLTFVFTLAVVLMILVSSTAAIAVAQIQMK